MPLFLVVKGISFYKVLTIWLYSTEYVDILDWKCFEFKNGHSTAR